MAVRRSGWAVVVAMALVVACSGGDGGGGVEVGQDPEGPGSAPQVEVGSALEPAVAPLDQHPGSNLTADDEAMWYTDFEHLARFSVTGGTWSVFDLPAAVTLLRLDADGSGGVVALAGLCDAAVSNCGDETPELVLWWVDPEGRFREIPFDAELPSDPYVTFRRISGAGMGLELLVTSNSRTAVVTVGEEVAAVEQLEATLLVACQVEGGYLALVDQPGRSPLTTVQAGPTLAALAERDVPTEARELVESMRAVVVCTADGLAVIGPDTAWETTDVDAEWTTVPSDLGDAASRQLVMGWVEGPGDGEVFATTPDTSLRRTGEGWQLLGTDDDGPSRALRYAVVEDTVIEYPHPEAPR